MTRIPHMLPALLSALPAVFLAAAPALAHAAGPGGHGAFSAGLTHTLFGSDHVLAMLAVGLWAGAMGGRARSSVCMATLKPSPSAPRRWAAGTRTPSKFTTRVSLARCPILSSFLPGVIPGASERRTKAQIPVWRCEGSSVAKTV